MTSVHILWRENNATFFCEKVVSSESGEKYAQINYCLQVKTVQESSKQICWWILMWEENRGITFLVEVLLWIMDL